MPLLPKAVSFYDKFDRHVEITVEGVKLLQDLLSDLEHAGAKSRRISEVEHEADVIMHQTMEMLHKTFITPFDRDYIHRLMSAMDDILDYVEAAAERLTLYEIAASTPEALQMARILRLASEEQRKAVTGLRAIKKSSKEILAACIDVNRLENEADDILRQAIARLFKEEKDPLLVMKWKEIYESLESAIDCCEDVANVIEGIVLENA